MKPILPSEVHVGMVLPWPVYDRTGKLLLRSGETIASEAFMRIVLERGHTKDPAAERRESSEEEKRIEREARSVLSRVQALYTDLEVLHRELAVGRAEDATRRLTDIAKRMTDTAVLDQDALLALLQIDLDDCDLVRRTLHATALADLMTRAVKLDTDTRFSVVTGALVYDVGLIDLQRAFNRQRPTLTNDQREKLHRHPTHAVALLKSAGIADGVLLDAVLHHHERIDGSGYPHHVRGDALAVGARILAIADIYSAMVRPRAYRDAIHSRVALREIFMERGKLIDETVATLFIKEMGVFPPGTLVKLRNNEIAVVAGRGESAGAPTLRCVILADGTMSSRPPLRDARAPEHAMVETISWSRYRAALPNLHPLWDGRGDVAALGSAPAAA